MLPSPSLARANDNNDASRHATKGNKPVLPIGSLPDPDSDPFDFGHHILLSPPPSTKLTDPFDDEARREFLDVDSISRHNNAAHGFNAQYASQELQEGQTPSGSEPIATGLQIKTDLPANLESQFSPPNEYDSYLRHSISATSIPKRTPSLRAALHSSAGSLSPGSALSSPQLAAILNVTPLPSPIETSKDPWRVNIRTRSRGSSLANAEASLDVRPSTLSPTSSPPKRKNYNSLRSSSGDSYTRLSEVTSENDAPEQSRIRSISDYVPDAMVLAKPRNVAVSGNILNQDLVHTQSTMHREEYLAVQRGFSVPSPPLKTSSTPASTPEFSSKTDGTDEPETRTAKAHFYTAKSVASGHVRRYKMIRQLGQGTFSKVFLAVRQTENEDDDIDYTRDSTNLHGVHIRSRRLVAVKVVEQGPAGGANAERVEVSLRREVEVLKAINHPSLVHLKAFGTENDRSLLVLNYCPGGDLFEVASTRLEVLVPSLVRRIFAELVSAVRYLHQKFIVHRDIKLESKSRMYDASPMLMPT